MERAAMRIIPRPTEVPGWIVTFSDMTTNLLTFFVLLLSMGQIRDDTLFDEGQRLSFFFLESVKVAFGVQKATDFDYVKLKHFVEKPDKLEGTTIDARREQTRRLFNTLRRSMEARPSQITADRVYFSVADVSFAPGRADLDEIDRQHLAQFCRNLQQTIDSPNVMLYVVGLTGDQATEAQQWTLSAQRAQTVADVLKQTLSAMMPTRTDGTTGTGQHPWPVLWWGAGPGGNWAGQDRPNADQSQVLIAVLKTDG
jgi:flagellar motor protein MotB